MSYIPLTTTVRAWVLFPSTLFTTIPKNIQKHITNSVQQAINLLLTIRLVAMWLCPCATPRLRPCDSCTSAIKQCLTSNTRSHHGTPSSPWLCHPVRGLSRGKLHPVWFQPTQEYVQWQWLYFGDILGMDKGNVWMLNNVAEELLGICGWFSILYSHCFLGATT